jgi:hypothetical protein
VTREKSYYGPFFWLAALSFIVPIVVAVKAFDAAPRLYSVPESNPDASGVDVGLWDYLLKSYTREGLVDYEGMKRDHLFKTVIAQIGSARPEELASDEERLALLCNAYNVFVINGVITHDVSESVMAETYNDLSFFDVEEHIFAGTTMSLNHLEHGIIRVDYAEPRIHMALVCAARSCPVIRAEAYTGVSLERQLDDQARQFANNPTHVAYDAAAGSIRLSKILEWYGGDFDGAGGVFEFLAPYVTDAALKGLIVKAGADEVDVVYNEYDWALNTTGDSVTRGGSQGADFGSGSVPNE